MSEAGGLTDLLQAWSHGDPDALAELASLVHHELRQMARRMLAGERVGHEWQPTELINESFLRLLGWRGVEWKNRAQFQLVLIAALACTTACAIATTSRPDRSDRPITLRESVTPTSLHGKRLDLHLAVPDPLVRRDLLIVYASGDGGWFGSAVDQWQRIARAGYATVGFSARTFLRIERPKGALLNPARLADEYARIVQDAREALGWQDSPQVILAGWSRGAAFSVLVGGEPALRDRLVGVVAIGLPEGENLTVGDDDDDDGSAPVGARHWAFDTYARLLRLPVSCAVIQATGDHYFPAASARRRFGPDTATRRFYEVDARNHRFSGGSAAFDLALTDVLKWMSSPSPDP